MLMRAGTKAGTSWPRERLLKKPSGRLRRSYQGVCPPRALYNLWHGLPLQPVGKPLKSDKDHEGGGWRRGRSSFETIPHGTSQYSPESERFKWPNAWGD